MRKPSEEGNNIGSKRRQNWFKKTKKNNFPIKNENLRKEDHTKPRLDTIIRGI
jgi:hypothetical protein